ncbi:MAG: copper amine oxidase N-terminal domain-containing protein [Oscillospiraceae bacterium]|nr:copper amine oxidase N-terminal domain-containing protein [Oscillospiraceae bacterium]
MIKKVLLFFFAFSLTLMILSVPTFAATASPTASTVLVNGQSISFDAYNISDYNYFKLRDLAYALSGTEKQFEVSWDGANNAISLTSGLPYSVVGGEMTGKGSDVKEATPTDSIIFLNGLEIQFTAYYIDGNNYFRLRDIGETFDFGVDWDNERDTIAINTNKGYSLEDGSGAAQPTPTVTPATTPDPGVNTDSDSFGYSDLAGKVFYFASGVGAWSTEVEIMPDGTFKGNFHDSDMGDVGPGYPNGTFYYCTFSGKFSPLTKIGEFEYSMKCETLTQEGSEGDTKIVDGVRNIVSLPYGFDDADVFRLYLPGRKVDDLPEMFLDWVSMPRVISFEKGDTLGFYGLYNVAGEFGFSCD